MQKDIAAAAGRDIIAFLAASIYAELTGRVLVIEHSFVDKSKYCRDSEDKEISPEIIAQITAKIKNIKQVEWRWGSREAVLASMNSHEVPEDERLPGTPCGLKKEQLKAKRGLIRTWHQDPLPLITAEGEKYWDIWIAGGRLITHTVRRASQLTPQFQLIPYTDGGLVLRAADISGQELQPFHDMPRFFAAISAYEHWGRVLQCEDIASINNMVLDATKIKELCWVAEGLHEKRISEICTQLIADKTQIVTIAGPSSSGKTTFSKRLAIGLRVQEVDSVVISMDDYFMNRADMPTNDLESPDIVHVGLLAERIKLLFDGQEIPVRRFDFKLGVGIDDNVKRMKLARNGMVVIEGIHMLNPSVLSRLPSKPKTIYIAPITQLNVDDQHSCSSTDTRLIRRIIRDSLTRGYSAEVTLSRWPSVRAGEERNIFPYQEGADFTFNSALIYELNILSVWVRPLLCEISEHASPEVKDEAARLISYLSWFYPLNHSNVLGISLLREFIGDSQFEY